MDIIVQQITDPFRVGMVFFLLLTALRTRATMGLAIPLGLGTLFVAALIPLTLQGDAYPALADKVMAFGYGVVSNILILGLCLGGWLVARRVRG